VFHHVGCFRFGPGIVVAHLPAALRQFSENPARSEATMERNMAALIGMVGLAVLAAFAVYRWRQRDRVRRVERWVKDYLVTRGGQLPTNLHINCSDDTLWPVLVSFDGLPGGGTRHYLQFGCEGPVATFSLLSEKEEKH
jgi:hypothetical protein